MGGAGLLLGRRSRVGADIADIDSTEGGFSAQGGALGFGRVQSCHWSGGGEGGSTAGGHQVRGQD